MNDKYTVGQTVLLSDHYSKNRPVEVPVVRVGRTLVYIERYKREYAFYIADGREKRSPNAGGYGATIYTPEEWATLQARQAVLSALSDRGIRFYPGTKDYSTGQLQRIVAILDETEEEK